MVSVLRTLQAEWNALVPQAQELGIRRVRPLNAPLETIDYRRGKVEWLRGEIARLTGTSSTPALTSNLNPVELQPYPLDIDTFGVELEFVMPSGMTRHRIAELCMAVGVRCEAESYNHNTGPHWKVVTDASVDSTYTFGAEIVSPPLRGTDGFLQLTKVCDVLKGVGCKVTKKCGLHVHVGARDWALNSFKYLVILYANAEASIDSFMAPSRRGSENHFCQPMRINHRNLERANNIDQIAIACGQNPGRSSVRGSGRYKKLNLQSFWQHGTVEFRHHQGTIEADKALNWTKLCLRMCAAAKNGYYAASDFDTFFTMVRSPAAEKAFFQGRADYFASNLQRTERAAERRACAQSGANRLTEQGPALTGFAELPRSRLASNPFEETGSRLDRAAHTRGQE